MARGRRKQEYTTEKRKLPVRIFFFLLAGAIILGMVVFALSPFISYAVKVDSGAMSPAISISDTVGVNHLAYLLLPPGRGDIIQFQTGHEEGGRSSGTNTYSIRRIVALPGETVQIADGAVYINGHPLEEDYCSGELIYGGTAASALTLRSDEYFVMADNRSNNSDSRDSTIGPVPESDIIGKVWLRLKPFERFGLIK